MNQFTFQRFVTYFFRGLLLVVPFVLTSYIIFVIFEWLDGIIPLKVPGLGILILVSIITLLGYLASFFVTRSVLELAEKYFVRIPLINIIYTSIKDLITAFVGDAQKFKAPVTVALDSEKAVLKIGFITQSDLSKLDLPGYVSVYMPHSYNFSGNHFLIEKSRVKPLNLRGGDAMKFVVSGGVSGLEEESKPKLQV